MLSLINKRVLLVAIIILIMLRRDGIEKELASRADQRVLRWFGHVERMDEYRMPEGC